MSRPSMSDPGARIEIHWYSGHGDPHVLYRIDVTYPELQQAMPPGWAVDFDVTHVNVTPEIHSAPIYQTSSTVRPRSVRPNR